MEASELGDIVDADEYTLDWEVRDMNWPQRAGQSL